MPGASSVVRPNLELEKIVFIRDHLERVRAKKDVTLEEFLAIAIVKILSALIWYKPYKAALILPAISFQMKAGEFQTAIMTQSIFCRSTTFLLPSKVKPTKNVWLP